MNTQTLAAPIVTAKKCGVFISYQHVNPDMQSAQALVDLLAETGIQVIYDRQIEVGERWVQWIDDQVRRSTFLIVLISATSIRSDMVRQEIRIAHEYSRENGGNPRILPIRINYTGALPYDLAAYLDPLQYLLWTDGTPAEEIADKLLPVLVREELTTLEQPINSEGEQQQSELFAQTLALGAPLPSADFLLETGAVKQDSPFYVKRSCDTTLFTHGKGNGVTMVIKGPRQVGKSSLLARFYADVRDSGATCFMLDFQSIDEERFTDLQTLLKFIARRIEKTLRLTCHVNDIWDDEEGPKINIMDYLQQALIDASDKQIYLFFDEVDRVFPYKFSNDFFSTLRGWHNERAHNRSWNKLNLVLVHSTEPHLWITDEFQSPFNVGYTIQLDDFTTDQVSFLNAGYGRPLSETDLADFCDLTGGHPLLVRQGLFSMSQKGSGYPGFREGALELHGPYGDHLKRYLWGLQQNKALNSAFLEIIRRGRSSDELHFYKLRAAGLVKGESRDRAQPRCRLYEQFFGRHL